LEPKQLPHKVLRKWRLKASLLLALEEWDFPVGKDDFVVDAGAQTQTTPSGGSPERLRSLTPYSSPGRGLFLLSGQDTLCA
jgi:hypothetical protein